MKKVFLVLFLIFLNFHTILCSDGSDSNAEISPSDETDVEDACGRATSLSKSGKGANTDNALSGREESDWDSFFFPVVFYTPETSLGMGGALIMTGKSEGEIERIDNINIVASYTLKSQSIFLLIPDFYFNQGRTETVIGLFYKNFPTSYYGIGDSTREEDEETYAEEEYRFNPVILRMIYRQARIGFGLDWDKLNLKDMEKDGKLIQDSPPGIEGGQRVGMGFIIDWDTRDNAFFTLSGGWYRFSAYYYREAFGSDYNYENYEADLRRFLPLTAGQTLGIQLYGACTSVQETPFFDMPKVGDRLRGIEADRFRDHVLYSLQMEYRFFIRGRFSGVLFAGTGNVFQDTRDFKFSDLKSSYGFGLRYALDKEKRINLRLDIGFSEYGVYPYFQNREAF